MAELEVDQSNLPRVQEVSQYFSVLEDGALAHNLQEQEIEQHYSSNVQRNQLVQKDIRVAKRLQDEEQQRVQMLRDQAARQLEDQDSEYAHRIQEEIQRAAEEERKREEKDEEIAKRIQEEEDLYVRQMNSCYRTKENGIAIGSPNRAHPRHPHFSEEEESGLHSRARSSSSPTSDYEAEQEHRRPYNRGYTESVEQRHRPVREQPLRRRSVQSRSSFASQGSSSSTSASLQGGWAGVVQLIKNDLNEQGYLSCSSEDELFEPVYKLERVLSRRQRPSEQHGARPFRHSSMRERNGGMWPGDQASRTEGYRHSDYKDSRIVRTVSRPVRRYSSSDYKAEERQRRVRFQEGSSIYTDCQREFEGNPFGLREPRNCRPHQGNLQADRRTCSEVIRSQRYEDPGVRTCLPQEMREDEEECERFRERGRWERGSFRGQTEYRHSGRQKWRDGRRSRKEQSRMRVRQGNEEESSSTEEGEMDREYVRRREETCAPRQPRRCLSASFRGRPAGPGQSTSRPSLDLGELRQVLQDEELARRLQEEEEELLRRDLATSPCKSYPKGDFTVAQVAQDEEIARFMQKQEIKTKLRSRELEDRSPEQEYRDMSPVYDNRGVSDGQVPRERLNSEGLLSPGDECSPEHQPPHSVTLTEQHNHFRNIAEELDPTFQRSEIMLSGQNIPGTCQMQPTSQTESCQEPVFVAPTKRQNDKPVRAKSKEKKDSKSRESCKQQ